MMSNEQANNFRQYCIVELFGHQMIAGLVSEQQIGGQSFVRVDVPAIDGRDAYTKLYGAGAIYAITPTDEETTKQMTASLNQPPVSEWHFRQTMPQLPRSDDGWQEEDD